MTQKDDAMPEESIDRALIRLQERQTATAEQLGRIERMVEGGQRESAAAIKELATTFNKAFEKASAEYVTKAEFAPVKTAVFAVIGLMGAGVVGALLAQVIVQ